MDFESLLQASVIDSSLRTEFGQRLSLENFYVLVRSEIPQGAQIFQIPGQPDFTWAVFKTQDGARVPSFTSLDTLNLFLNQVSGWERRWIETSGQMLLKQLATNGNLWLEINPASKFSVGLPPTAIKDLCEKLPNEKI